MSVCHLDGTEIFKAVFHSVLTWGSRGESLLLNSPLPSSDYMMPPCVTMAEAGHLTSLVTEEGVEQSPEAPLASRKIFQKTSYCISKKSF